MLTCGVSSLSLDRPNFARGCKNDKGGYLLQFSPFTYTTIGSDLLKTEGRYEQRANWYQMFDTWLKAFGVKKKEEFDVYL